MSKESIEFLPIHLGKDTKLARPIPYQIEQLQSNGVLVMHDVIDYERLLRQTQLANQEERRQPVYFLELVKEERQPIVLGVVVMHFFQQLGLDTEKDKLIIESNGWTARIKGKPINDIASDCKLYTPWMGSVEIKTTHLEGSIGVSEMIYPGDLGIVRMPHGSSVRAAKHTTEKKPGLLPVPKNGKINHAYFTSTLRPKIPLPNPQIVR